MNQEALLNKIKKTIREIEPEADIYLYGSRARGDSTQDSDWDLLILVEGSVNDIRTDQIRHRLYEIEWESDHIISSIVRTRKQWNSIAYHKLPIRMKVESEGILI